MRCHVLLGIAAIFLNLADLTCTTGSREPSAGDPSGSRIDSASAYPDGVFSRDEATDDAVKVHVLRPPGGSGTIMPWECVEFRLVIPEVNPMPSHVSLFIVYGWRIVRGGYHAAIPTLGLADYSQVDALESRVQGCLAPKAQPPPTLLQ